MADSPALTLSRLEVSQALESVGDKFPLAGRDDDILGPLAYTTLRHAATAYAEAGDAHRHTHLLLAALSWRATTDPATFVAPLPSIACIPDGATFLRRMRSIYHDLLLQTAEAAAEPRAPSPSPNVDVFEYAALGLGQQMALLLTATLSTEKEALHYRNFATLLLEVGAALATHDKRPEIVTRDLATAIIVDTADGDFAPLARVHLDQLPALTEYFGSMADRYALAGNLDFLFRPSA